ncbi:MAG: hypothetical protein ISS71_02630 [Phycisphaerae bacterium]|nr:hypothetical protein [Phycisphaerae bacterium]
MQAFLYPAQGKRDLLIGTRLYNGVYYDAFEGLIDQVRIYTRDMDASETQDIYLQYALIADMEPDGDVDMNDFTAFANFWQNSESCDGDLTCDCIVDIEDFLILADEWLHQIPSN